jgi:hypothetical protein
VTQTDIEPKESTKHSTKKAKTDLWGVVNRHRRLSAVIAAALVLAIAGTSFAIVQANSGARTTAAGGPVGPAGNSQPKIDPVRSCAPGAVATNPGQQVSLAAGSLGKALLTPADLPAGWSRAGTSKGASTGASSGFAPLDKLISSVAGIPAHQGVRFTKGTSGMVEEFVAASTPTQAGAVLRTFAETSQQCVTFQQPASGGKSNRVAVAPLVVRVPADQACAIKMTVTTGTGPAVVDVVASRLGNSVVVMYFAQIGKVDADLLSGMLGKAASRVRTA